MQITLTLRAVAFAGWLLWWVPARGEQIDLEARLSKAFFAIDRAVALSAIPSIVVGITDRQQTRKVISHGFSDLKTKTPITPESLFPIGSISKSFTAIALMQLFDAGRFDPQAPIAQYLPWFKVNSRFAPITGHHLLSHTSGLPVYLADLSSSRYAVYALREFEPSYAPGAHFMYSNTGFQILGYVVESIEGAPYRTLIERKVLKPLGMTSSLAAIDDSQRAKLPVSYDQWPYDDTYVEAPWYEYTAADGSIVSTLADMCAYARFILNRGAIKHGRLLSERAFDLLTTPVLEDYAYGLRVRKIGGDTVISHSGGIAGFEAHFEAHMNEGFAVILLGNGGLDRALSQWIVETMGAAYRDAPLTDPPPLPSTLAASETGQYVGKYRASDGQGLEFLATAHGLLLKRGNSAVPLERMGRDRFRTQTDDPNSFPFIFGRTARRAGAKVVEVSHGAQWYPSDAYIGARGLTTPPEYLAYVGHFENHNPEGPDVRVFVRNGKLMILSAGERDAIGQSLLQLGRGVFRPAEPAYSPERYRFDAVVEGRALRLIITGTPLYRVDTQ